MRVVGVLAFQKGGGLVQERCGICTDDSKIQGAKTRSGNTTSYVSQRHWAQNSGALPEFCRR